MAKPILCNGPDGGPAAVILTMVDEGETIGLCGPCLVDWCHALLKTAAPDLLKAEPAKPARKPRAKPPAKPTPVVSILGPDGKDSGETSIGGRRA